MLGYLVLKREGGGGPCNMLLKIFCKLAFGLMIKPKLERHYFLYGRRLVSELYLAHLF